MIFIFTADYGKTCRGRGILCRHAHSLYAKDNILYNILKKLSLHSTDSRILIMICNLFPAEVTHIFLLPEEHPSRKFPRNPSRLFGVILSTPRHKPLCCRIKS